MAVPLPRVLVGCWLAVACAVAAGCGSGLPPPRHGLSPSSEVPQAAVSREPSELEREGTRPGWLGVQLGAVPTGEAGVRVEDLVPGGPAAEAGLAPGDVILSVGGVPTNEPPALVRLISGASAGQRVAIGLRRGAAERLVAVELGAIPNTDEAMHKTYVGSPAPSLGVLKTVQGSLEPSLAKLKGKVVVVEFWATWCSVCRMLVPVMNEWHSRYGAQGVSVIGITSERIELASQAASSLGMEYPLASDESGKTTLAYRALAVPTVFVIDQEGTVREVMVGYSSPRLAELESKIRELLARSLVEEKALPG